MNDCPKTRDQLLAELQQAQEEQARLSHLLAAVKLDASRCAGALHKLAQGFTAGTGKRLINALAQYLAKALAVDYVLIGELVGNHQASLKAISVYTKSGRIAAHPDHYQLAGILSENIIGRALYSYFGGQQPFPQAANLAELGIESYVGVPLVGSAGKPLGFIAAIHSKPLHNISYAEPLVQIVARRIEAAFDRQRVEDELRESQRFLSTLMNNLPGMVYRCTNDRDYTMEFVSEGCLKLTGYHPADLIGNSKISYGQLIHQDDQEFVWNQVQAGLQENRAYQLTYRITTGLGGMKWVWEQGRGVFSPTGELVIVEGFITDITDLKRAETELAVARTEMEIAKQIQQSLLPEIPPSLNGVVFAGRCIPAAQVGGDYFDYFQREKDAVDLCISDVSGHGVGSGLLMIEVRSVLRAQAQLANNAANVLHTTNKALYDDLNSAELFITMFYAKYHARSRELSYASAGHNPPLIFRNAIPACTMLDAEGLILGIKRDVSFEERRIQLERGDVLIFYTDGITEAQNAGGELFGLGRLCEVLAANCTKSPDEIIDAILEKAESFCQKKSFADDITMIVMKVL